MARALDAGSDAAFTGRTSELRGKEKDPQPDRLQKLWNILTLCRVQTGPAAPAEAAAVPIPISPVGPQSSRRKGAGSGGCGDDRVS